MIRAANALSGKAVTWFAYFAERTLTIPFPSYSLFSVPLCAESVVASRDFVDMDHLSSFGIREADEPISAAPAALSDKKLHQTNIAAADGCSDQGWPGSSPLIPWLPSPSS
jgi:hypothetical protein